MRRRRTDMELMRLHVSTLFRFDAQGRMVSTNEVPPMPVPRFYLGRSFEGNTGHLRNDLPASQAARLATLLESEPPLGTPAGEPTCLDAVLAILGETKPVASVHRGPAFVFETAPSSAPGTRRLESGNRTPYHPELREMGWSDPPDDSRQPFIVAEADGYIVAICHSARATVEAVAAGVSTAPTYRRQGLGREVTQSWADEAMAGGRTAFYSTTWDNAASRAIAEGLGLRYFGEDCSDS